MTIFVWHAMPRPNALELSPDNLKTPPPPPHTHPLPPLRTCPSGIVLIRGAELRRMRDWVDCTIAMMVVGGSRLKSDIFVR
jgi:hypothetical protein